jgi:hypothetical protein
LSTWLLIIQLLWTMRLSFPSSLASNPKSPSFLPSFYFLTSAYFDLLSMLVALVSFVTFCSLTWLTCFMFSWDCACDLRILILSWRRSLILCSFFK